MFLVLLACAAAIAHALDSTLPAPRRISVPAKAARYRRPKEH